VALYSWDDEQVAVTVYFIVEAGQLPATDEEARAARKLTV